MNNVTWKLHYITSYEIMQLYILHRFLWKGRAIKYHFLPLKSFKRKPTWKVVYKYLSPAFLLWPQIEIQFNDLINAFQQGIELGTTYLSSLYAGNSPT